MIDERDPRDPVSQAALISAGIAGALLGGAVMWCLQAFRAGDEPPIRVKGGSLHMDIGAGAIWKQRGTDGTKWMLSRGTRGKEEYDVSIVASGGSCAAFSGKKVRVEYSDGRWVKIEAPGNKTKVDASDPLTLSSSQQRLSFTGSGYISKLEVDSNTCHFNQGEFDHALLAEF